MAEWLQNPEWLVYTNSDPDAENTPFEAFDNNPETLWIGSPEENPPHWVILDLGSPFLISGVRLQTVSDISHTVRSFSLLFGQTAEGPFITIESFKCKKDKKPQEFIIKKPRVVQFLKIYIGSTYGGWQAHVKEISFLLEPTEEEIDFPNENWLNPTPEWIVSFSDAKEGYGPDQLFDDADSGTWWNPRGEPPSWIVLDLQQPIALSRVKLTTIDDNVHTVKTFHLMVGESKDGPFSTVSTFISKQTAESQEFVLPKPVHAQFVQIFVDSSIGGGSARITDLNFFGNPCDEEKIELGEVHEHAKWLEPSEEWLVFYSSGSPVHGPAENLLLAEWDDNYKKMWNPFPEEKPPHWLILDLKGVQTLYKLGFIYSPDHNHTPADIFIQTAFSQEGPWKTQTTLEIEEPSEEERGEPFKEAEYLLPLPVTSRFIKIIIHSTWGEDQFSISRIKFFGVYDWKCKDHESLNHDIFINYRVYSEKDLAMKLALRLGQLVNDTDELTSVFLDRLCLKDGEDWEAGFIYGLKHSTLIVLLISEAALANIPRAISRQDNVLLEYEAALEKLRKKEAQIFPLLVDNPNGTPFKHENLPEFPDAPHCSPKSNANIKATMTELFQLEGTPISPGDGFLKVCPAIIQKLNQAIKERKLKKGEQDDTEQGDE